MRQEIKNILGMRLLEVEHKSCIAHFGFDEKEKWITLYDINTKNQGKGEAQKLLLLVKSAFENYKFGGTVALTPAMKHIYNKLNILEYN